MREVEKLTVGGLVHDIGKIVRRADNAKADHTKQGIDFLSDDSIIMEDKAEILRMVANHHGGYLKSAKLEKNDLAYILYEADNIASGIDRRKYEEEGFFGDEMSALKSIFTAINPDSQKNSYYILPNPTEEDEILLPSFAKTPLLAGINDYYSIKDKHIRSNFRDMKISGDTIHSLLGLLEATTSCIPASSYADAPEISLYDHSKMTAAIANCLYLYFTANNLTDFKALCFDSQQAEDVRKENTMLFVSGELSGVQSFIYSIASFSAMKSLRGRSFYLELFTEHIIDEILSGIELNRANLIYSGGSAFHLLLPNTPEALKTLDKVKEGINTFLLNKYSIELYFELSATKCSAQDLGNSLKESKKNHNPLGELFEKNSIKSARSKQNRYSMSQLEDLLTQDSAANKVEDYSRECPICKASKPLISAQSMDGQELCRDCYSFIEFGRILTKSANAKDDFYIVFSKGNYPKSDASFEVPDGNGGKDARLSFVSAAEAEKFLKETAGGYQNLRVYSINRKTTGPFVTANLWVGDYNIPGEDGKNLIEFNALVEKSKGINRLAVLRADVDNLGAIFASGFEDKTTPDNRFRNSSISRMATFSRTLSEFFKKDINIIASRSADIEGFSYCDLFSEGKGGQDIVIVYSGGDDIFAIGTWSSILEFSIDLRELFSLYSIDKLTFSAGIGFFKNGYPVSQMALKSGDLEKLAKENPDKNSIALFGVDYTTGENHVYDWPTFIDDVLYTKYVSMKKWFYFQEEDKDEGKILAGKSFLYKLLNLVRTNLSDSVEKIDFARLVYTLSRISYPDTAKPTYIEARSTIIEWFKDKKELKKLLTALSLIIYEIRD